MSIRRVFEAVRTVFTRDAPRRLSGEWISGIFAAMWGKFNDRARKDNTWILCDGPVDAVWIENLNTVLDDNKILTLANGDRIPMTDNVKLMFEVEDLRNASPATVSRAGIIFVSASDLDWEPILKAWLNQCDDVHHPHMLREHFENYLGHCSSLRDCGLAFEWLRANCNVPISVSRVGMVEKTLTLMDALLSCMEISESIDDAHHELERCVLFSLTWGVAGLLESDDRLKWDAWLREMDSEPTNMPLHVAAGESIFEYGINPETMEWERWSIPVYKPPKGDVEDWSGVLVPTLETTRCGYILGQLRSRETPVLLLGGSGTAKTSTAYMFFDSLDGDKNIIKKMNFSFATTPGSFQGSIEAELDKQGGKSYGPPTGKRMTIFLDDLSMPEVRDSASELELWEDGVTYLPRRSTRGATSPLSNSLDSSSRRAASASSTRTSAATSRRLEVWTTSAPWTCRGAARTTFLTG